MVNTTSSLEALADTYLWKQVPAKVEEYVTAGAHAASLLKKATARFPQGAGHALLAPLRNELWIVRDDDSFDYNRWEKLATLSAINNVAVDAEFPADPEGWIYIKTGAENKKPWMVHDVAGIPHKLWKAPGKLIGGHNPATGALTGAALGGLGGYALGKGLSWAIRKPLGWLFPDYVDEEESDWWAPALAVAGGTAGAGLPLWIAKAQQEAHGGNYWSQKISSAPAKGDPETTELFHKVAMIGGVGAMFQPTINAPRFVGQLNDSMSPFSLHSPKDAFGNPVISHAIQPPNPFGTKNPFGSPYQQMYTPPPAAGAMAGMVSGAAAARRSSWVSPMDIAKMAWGAGAGSLSGIIAGKIAGGLAGVNSNGQKKLQQMGMWGGLLSAAARAIF